MRTQRKIAANAINPSTVDVPLSTPTASMKPQM
jgi:hypothetical protein